MAAHDVHHRGAAAFVVHADHVDAGKHLEELGFDDVATYIQSGNVVLRSDLTAKALVTKIENNLPRKFKLDSSVIKILALLKVSTNLGVCGCSFQSAFDRFVDLSAG